MNNDILLYCVPQMQSIVDGGFLTPLFYEDTPPPRLGQNKVCCCLTFCFSFSGDRSRTLPDKVCEIIKPLFSLCKYSKDRCLNPSESFSPF